METRLAGQTVKVTFRDGTTKPNIPIQEPILLVGQLTGGGFAPLQVAPDGTLAVTTESVAAVTGVVSTALEASHIIKASAGKLVSVSIDNTGASTQYYLLMNSATVPADGAVVLLYPPIPVASNTITRIDFPTPLTATTGIVICNGPNNSFTKAIGAADSIYQAQVI